VSGQLHVRPLYPRGKSPQYPLYRGPEPVWMMLRKENSWPYRDSNSDPSVVQPVAGRYTDYAIPAQDLGGGGLIGVHVCYDYDVGGRWSEVIGNTDALYLVDLTFSARWLWRLWLVMPCSLAEVRRHSGGSCRLSLQVPNSACFLLRLVSCAAYSMTLKMEVEFCWTTWCLFPPCSRYTQM
jgi:hypothetical protein